MQTALLDMYANSGLVDDARYVFDEMLDRDVVSWIAIVLRGTQLHGWPRGLVWNP